MKQNNPLIKEKLYQEFKKEIEIMFQNRQENVPDILRLFEKYLTLEYKRGIRAERKRSEREFLGPLKKALAVATPPSTQESTHSEKELNSYYDQSTEDLDLDFTIDPVREVEFKAKIIDFKESTECDCYCHDLDFGINCDTCPCVTNLESKESTECKCLCHDPNWCGDCETCLKYKCACTTERAFR